MNHLFFNLKHRQIDEIEIKCMISKKNTWFSSTQNY